MTFKPGDLIDVTIKGAHVQSAGSYWVTFWVDESSNLHSVHTDAPGVTVEHVAPAEWPPQPGDLWRDNGDELWFVVQLAPDDIAMLPSYPVSSSKRGVKPDRVRSTVGPLTLVHREGDRS